MHAALGAVCEYEAIEAFPRAQEMAGLFEVKAGVGVDVDPGWLADVEEAEYVDAAPVDGEGCVQEGDLCGDVDF